MKRYLTLLNVLLIAGIAMAGWRIREEWLTWQTRQQSLLAGRTKPVPAPPIAPDPAQPQLTPANFVDVAQKMLFTRDRNADVVVEPPPEKPLPERPRVHGVMNLGDGLTVIMSEKAGARHHGVQIGQTIGEYKLAAIEGRTLVFEWEDKTVRKSIDELISRRADGPADAAPAAAPAPTGGRILAETAPPPPPPKASAEPGRPIDERKAACQPGDDSPAGTVANGMRKVIVKTPFGDSCYWESVN